MMVLVETPDAIRETLYRVKKKESRVLRKNWFYFREGEEGYE